MPVLPPVPKPRRDLQPRPGRSPEDYQKYLDMLEVSLVDFWREPDGKIYLTRIPASMAPGGVGTVDSAGVLAPDSPVYAEWESELTREYDFMSPTKVKPVPRGRPDQPPQKEAPDAQAADSQGKA